MNESKIVEGLNDLLAKNYDSEKGFLSAADATDNLVHAALFRGKASQRYDYGHQIKDVIKEMGGDVDKGTSLAGDLHRAWFNFKHLVSFDKEEALLEEIERGEEACVDEYKDFLKNPELPHSIRRIVTAQKNGVCRSLNKMSELEDAID